MPERYAVTTARSYSSGTKGRCLNSARANHFVIDDTASNGGPDEAIAPTEAFLSGLTSCAVLMLERLSREQEIPLKWIDVSVEVRLDREAPRVNDMYLVNERVRMRFEMAGPSEAQARELVETYKRR